MMPMLFMDHEVYLDIILFNKKFFFFNKTTDKTATGGQSSWWSSTCSRPSQCYSHADASQTATCRTRTTADASSSAPSSLASSSSQRTLCPYSWRTHLSTHRSSNGARPRSYSLATRSYSPPFTYSFDWLCLRRVMVVGDRNSLLLYDAFNLSSFFSYIMYTCLLKLLIYYS